MAHAHPHPHPHQHGPQAGAAAGNPNAPPPIPDSMLHQHELTYDADSGVVTALGKSATLLPAEELVKLNMLIKAIAATNDNPQPLPPNVPPQFKMTDYIPPPPQPIPQIRSNHIAKAKDDGNTQFRQQKYQEAIKLYSISAGLASTRPTFESAQYSRDEASVALCNRSAAYAAAGAWIEALADANAVVGIKKQWTKGHFRKGKALLGLKRYEEARQAILLGLEFEPANEDLAGALEEIDKAEQASL